MKLAVKSASTFRLGGIKPAFYRELLGLQEAVLWLPSAAAPYFYAIVIDIAGEMKASRGISYAGFADGKLRLFIACVMLKSS